MCLWPMVSFSNFILTTITTDLFLTLRIQYLNDLNFCTVRAFRNLQDLSIQVLLNLLCFRNCPRYLHSRPRPQLTQTFWPDFQTCLQYLNPQQLNNKQCPPLLKQIKLQRLPTNHKHRWVTLLRQRNNTNSSQPVWRILLQNRNR